MTKTQMACGSVWFLSVVGMAVSGVIYSGWMFVTCLGLFLVFALICGALDGYD